MLRKGRRSCGSLCLLQAKRFMGTTANKNKVLILAGPTGAGKTDLSIQLASTLDGEIISADSVQVYKRLDIGSNKASPLLRSMVPHHLIDVLDHRSDFTVGDFYRLARAATEDILSRNKVPIVVGGTGFYLRWYINGESAAPRSDPEVRAKVEASIKADGGWDESIARLRRVDPETVEMIPKHDFYRLSRALEIYETSGKPPSFFRTQRLSLEDLDYDFRCIYIDRPNFMLYKREIDERCEIMIENGLLEEVIELMKDGFDTNTSAGRAIGYRHALNFLKSPNCGEKEFLHMLDDFMAVSRQYCRRQRTWFRKEPSFLWLPTGPSHEPALTEAVLAHYRKDYATYKAEYPTLHRSQAEFTEELGSDFRRLTRTYAPVLKRFDDYAHRKQQIARIHAMLGAAGLRR